MKEKIRCLIVNDTDPLTSVAESFTNETYPVLIVKKHNLYIITSSENNHDQVLNEVKPQFKSDYTVTQC